MPVLPKALPTKRKRSPGKRLLAYRVSQYRYPLFPLLEIFRPLRGDSCLAGRRSALGLPGLRRRSANPLVPRSACDWSSALLD